MSSLELMLRELRLGAVVRHGQEVAIRAEREGWSFTRYLHDLVEMELLERLSRRMQKRLKESGLPTGKTLTTLEVARLPEPVRRQLPTLCEGHFIERGHNILAFGLPGRGKTHLLCAIGQALIERGCRVLFTPAFKLVQRLLAAKHELRLEKELRRLDGYAAVSLDDIGYLQQNREEMEVLFTFLAERYERKSVTFQPQPRLQPMGPHLQRPYDHRRGHRPAGASCPHSGADRSQLSNRQSQGESQ
jgi:DNA replication protein DnaC